MGSPSCRLSKARLYHAHRMRFPLCWAGTLATVSLFTALLIVPSETKCPWKQKGLKLWSKRGTWPNKRVPGNNSQVTIPRGRRMLLDVQPEPLTSLTIEKGGALVWGNVKGLELRVEVVVVEGELIMGSPSCRLHKAAFVTLTGLSTSPHFVSDEGGPEIRKVILVREGGALEIHGTRKTPWTKLAQTVRPVVNYPCAFIYDHADHDANPFAEERISGLHVMVWNKDGTVFDYVPLQEFTALRAFVDSIPYGKVIALYVFGEGLCCRGRTGDFETLDDVIVSELGGNLITKVTKMDSYALITRKGMPSLTQEHYIYKGRDNRFTEQVEKYLQLPIWETQRDFQVARSSKSSYQYFRVLHTDAAYPILELAKNVEGWIPGDRIVVASTDYDWEQAEVRDIIDCHRRCTKSQIRVNESFVFMHYGNFTCHVDERAEVGLLSRNIVIKGEMQDTCYEKGSKGKQRCQRFGRDTFGGHIKILRGHASARVQGVELYHMGQQGVVGSYPLHFHMCDEAPGSYFRDNSIHHSFQRCVTIHGTDKVEVSGNVCYDHLGHGFFLEDSVEQLNVLKGNLGLGTRNGATLMSDMSREWCLQDYKRKFEISCNDVSTFWLTHPNNFVTDNAAAGGVGHGFMYVFADMPLGLSFERQKILRKVTKFSARLTPIAKFYNNVAHSYRRSGVFMDSRISTGKLETDRGIPENGIIQEENLFEPRDPPGDPNGRRLWRSKLERITAYKNIQNNMWIKGGNINLTFCSLADAATQSYSGGNTGLQTGTSLEYSVVIGRTDNKGEPRFYREELPSGVVLTHQFDRSVPGTPWQSVTGVGIYQGPMFVKNTYFDRFTTVFWNDSWTELRGKRPVSHAGAISFKKDGIYPTYTSQYTTNLTFGFCDKKKKGHWVFFGRPGRVFGWEDLDGPRQAHNLDKDGSLTGTPNTFIVRNRPFFTGRKCSYRRDWDMSVCPYRYIKFELLGSGGNLDLNLKDKWPVIASRDDEPRDVFKNEGKQRREYLARTYKSYLIDFNTSLPGGGFPSEFKIQGNGVESQDVIRIGVCVPKDLTEFEVRSDYPVLINRNNYTRVKNLKELDATAKETAVFHDRKNGIIFFKVWSLHDRTNDSQLCPAGLCFNIRVTLKNGNLTNMRNCRRKAKYRKFKIKGLRYNKVKNPTTCFGIGSPEGIGAVNWRKIRKIVHTEYSVPCESYEYFSGRMAPSYIGCFVSDFQPFYYDVRLPKTMTVEWCTLRCYQRNFQYAGLLRASMCVCGQSVNKTSEATDLRDRGCDLQCSGNPAQQCGNGNRLSIWTTGHIPDKNSKTYG